MVRAGQVHQDGEPAGPVGRGSVGKLCNFHLTRVTNGPAETLNNLIKRVKRIGPGFRNLENYRIRALLYPGKPNWRVPGSIIVR